MRNFSFKYKVFFIHVPKNAGTSINKILGIKKKQGGHNTLGEVLNEVGDEFYKHPSIGVIRNPWDRMVSVYKYRKKKKYEHHLKHYNYTFEDWLFDPFTPRISGHMEWLPQIQSLSSNNTLVNYILRYEELQEGWEFISEKLKLPSELPILNSTPGKPYREYYSDRSAEYVSQLFKADIDTFNYTF